MEDKSRELQAEIDRLSAKLGVRTMPVGLLTKDGLNIFVAEDNTYHFTFYERGQLGFDKVGSLNDLLYRYCQSIITREASARVGDRKDRFRYEYDWLSELDAEWAKRNVRETADMFRRWKPQDIALLPDIGEPL